MRKGLAATAVVVALAAGWFGWQKGWLGGSSSRGPRSVLLVSVDTLRADRLGSYGYQAASTPVLDALAARGLRFEQAATVAPLTLPAHTSLLSGTFPTFHGVRDNGSFYVNDTITTLAEVLQSRGYRTGGFVGAFVLDHRWGIAQGFDHYFDAFDLANYEMAAGLDAAQRPGSEVVDHALAWLDEDRDRPFLAWVHLYDPHSPYTPPEPYRSRFPATMQGAYDAEIAATDAQIGRLLDRLRESGRLDDTIVVVVADHGESLGEHGEQQHGFFVYDAAVRIPLIVAGPGVPARAVPEQVRIVDVMPTVLDLVGAAVPSEVQGVSLMPLGRGEEMDLLGFSETWYPRYHYGWSELTAVRDGRYKFIAAPRRELYDTQADPGETRDLAASNPRMADALERALREMATRTAVAATPQAPRAIDPAAEERLRALGYVASTISRAALVERPRGDPKDMIGLYNLLKLAGSDSVAGRLDEAIAKVRSVLAADPEVMEAHTILGNIHTKAGRLPDAIKAYQQALAVDPEHEGAAWSLALAYRQAGKLDEARAGFERVFQLNPRGAKALYQLAELSMRQGQFANAAATLEKGLALDGDRAVFLVKIAEARLELKQIDAAQAALVEAIKLKGDQSMAHYNLGLVHEARGEWQAAASEYEAEIKVSPKLYQPHFNLAKLLARDGRAADALTHFRAAVDQNPEFGTGFLYLAKALLDAGNLKDAEEAATRGLATKPDAAMVPLGHYVLADIYSRQGRDADAARQAAAGKRAEARGGSPGRR
ncbi:MAG: sulfatase-like hydrolase/transferase [Vicinamibacterales bacterium]|jgi:arylsulfatase A-like enzyme/predicted Zn-dependent protease